VGSHHLFFVDSVAVVLADVLDLSSVVFRYLDFGDVLLLGHDLLFHAVLLLHSDVVVAFLLFILTGLDLGLFSFLMFAELDGLLHLRLLFNTFTLDCVVSVSNLSLLVCLHLRVIHSLPEPVFVTLF